VADIRISFHVRSSGTFVTAIKPRAKEKGFARLPFC